MRAFRPNGQCGQKLRNIWEHRAVEELQSEWLVRPDTSGQHGMSHPGEKVQAVFMSCTKDFNFILVGRGSP